MFILASFENVYNKQIILLGKIWETRSTYINYTILNNRKVCKPQPILSSQIKNKTNAE